MPPEWRVSEWDCPPYGIVRAVYRDGKLDIGVNEDELVAEESVAAIGGVDVPFHVLAWQRFRDEGAPRGLTARHKRVWFVERHARDGDDVSAPTLACLLDENGMPAHVRNSVQWVDADGGGRLVYAPCAARSAPYVNVPIGVLDRLSWPVGLAHVPDELGWLKAYDVSFERPGGPRSSVGFWVPEVDWQVLGAVRLADARRGPRR